MTSHNEDANLTEITVTDPTTAQQNELIAQLIQRIADMEVQMKRNHELASLAITANLPAPDHERHPVHSPSPGPSHQPIPIATNPPITPAQASPVVNLTTSEARPSNIFFQNPHNAQAGSSSHIIHTTQPQEIHPENRIPDQCNLPPTQTEPPKMPFHIPIYNPHIPQSAYPEIDHYEEKEKEWKAKEEVTRSDVREEIAKAMKQFHHAPDIAGLNYEDLCIHPDLNLPEGFKIPKFDTFDGSGNPLAHLRAYCDQMVGAGRNEALLMRLFSRSLSGEALEWFTSQEINQWASWSAMAKDFVDNFAYNIEIVPDRYSLEKIKQKSTESYREYACRWRKNVARVRPPMTEKEIIEVFVRSQEPEFYERMIALVGAKFADVVKIGENIEDGLKTGKIIRLSNPSATSGILRKRREDVSAVSGIQDKRRISGNYPRRPTTSTPNHQSPWPDCSHIQPAYQNPTPKFEPSPSNYQTPPFQIPAVPRRNHPNNHRVPPPPQNNYNSPRPNADKRPLREFTQLAESRTKLFERLSAAGLIQPVPPKVMDVNSRFFRSDQTCAYHSNSVGHDTEDCLNLKHRIQDLIDRDVVVLRTVPPNVNKNPLPNHGENTAGMIEEEED